MNDLFLIFVYAMLFTLVVCGALYYMSTRRGEPAFLNAAAAKQTPKKGAKNIQSQKLGKSPATFNGKQWVVDGSSGGGSKQCKGNTELKNGKCVPRKESGGSGGSSGSSGSGGTQKDCATSGGKWKDGKCVRKESGGSSGGSGNAPDKKDCTATGGKWKNGKCTTGGSGGSGNAPGSGGNNPGGSGGGKWWSNEFGNNSYKAGKIRIGDGDVSSYSGTIITDPGNIIGKKRQCKAEMCALMTDADAAYVKEVLSQGGNMKNMIGYLSPTIENREDTKGLVKGKDYTPQKMDGWPEYAPMPNSKAWQDLMRRRIDLLAKAGFTKMEIDNLGIINDPYAGKAMGVTQQQWQNTISGLVQYANQQGLQVMQKNTPEGWSPEMTKQFAGMTLETKGAFGKGKADWGQVGAILESGKPLFVNHTGSGCDTIKQKIIDWTGVTTNTDNIILPSTC